jgi:hypothetical protein
MHWAKRALCSETMLDERHYSFSWATQAFAQPSRFQLTLYSNPPHRLLSHASHSKYTQYTLNYRQPMAQHTAPPPEILRKTKEACALAQDHGQGHRAVIEESAETRESYGVPLVS